MGCRGVGCRHSNRTKNLTHDLPQADLGVGGAEHSRGFEPSTLGIVSLCFISHEVSIKSFCKSQFPHKLVNLFFTSVMMKDKLTDLWGNRFLKTDFVNTFCAIILNAPVQIWALGGLSAAGASNAVYSSLDGVTWSQV